MMEMDAPSSDLILLIPVDLVMNILKRLSARDVLRSRSVCKEWNSLLRTPKFISLHYNRSIQMRHENAAGSSSFIYLRAIPSRPPFQSSPLGGSDPTRLSITLTFLTFENTNSTELVAKVDKEEDFMAMLSSLLSCPIPSGMYYQMICPFDGLACFLYGNHVIMYNPTTRESQVLPDPKFSIHYILGVWFESTVKQQYKVFGLVTGDHWYEIMIYDSTLNSWRVSRTMSGEVVSDCGLLLNGVLHFQIFDVTDIDDDDDDDEIYDFSDMIVTFDARLETFGHIEFPSSFSGINVILLTFHGNLAFMNSDIEMDVRMGDYYDDLWVMSEYGVHQSWTKKTLGPFDFSGYRKESNFDMHNFGMPLAFWKNKDEEDELLILAPKYTLFQPQYNEEN